MSIFIKKKKSIPEDAVPTTVEEAIPFQDIYEDGICLVGKNLYSKTYRFTDINYATASREDKEGMFLAYSQILNSFDTEADTKITINNRRMNKQKFEKHSLLELKGDMLDRYRAEYNQILTDQVNQSGGIMQDKYLTVTVEKNSLTEARNYFNRVGAEFSSLFASLGSRLEEVEREEKLRIIFDFFHYGSEEDFRFDANLYGQRGYSFKDAVAPDSFEFRSDYFKVDGRYGRVMYLRDYANFIKDNFMAELTDIDRGLMLSIDASPITTDQAIRQSENKLLAVETNISNWQRKQNQNNNFSAAIPYDMERQRTESKEFLNDLVARDQRMIPALITLVHTADTKDKLDADTESIRQCARKHLCSLNILRWQQLEGLNTVLPYGVPKLSMRRTLTTESLAVFMPFRVQEVCHNNGTYFANNAISKNMIMINRNELLNGNHPLIAEILGEVEKSYGDKLRTMTKKIDAATAEQHNLEELIKGKKEEELTQEEKDQRTQIKEKLDGLLQQRNQRLTEIGKENKLVKQIIDLALLSNSMLKGENLTNFIRRSVELIEK